MYSCRRASFVRPSLPARVAWWCRAREGVLAAWCGVAAGGVGVLAAVAAGLLLH